MPKHVQWPTTSVPTKIRQQIPNMTCVTCGYSPQAKIRRLIISLSAGPLKFPADRKRWAELIRSITGFDLKEEEEAGKMVISRPDLTFRLN